MDLTRSGRKGSITDSMLCLFLINAEGYSRRNGTRELCGIGSKKQHRDSEAGKGVQSHGDYKHIHIELNVPNTLQISQAIKILNLRSTWLVFQDILNFHKLSP